MKSLLARLSGRSNWIRFDWPATERGIVLAPVVGVVAGIGAVLFHLMCLVVARYSLATFAGYDQPGSGNEKTIFESVVVSGAALAPWMLLLVPTIGGLISGVLVYWLAPEAEGHGTDAAIDAYHNKRGLIRARVPLVKMVTSAITLGTGGSGGREGPIAQIGAGFGSVVATRLKLSDSERRIIMAAGLGAGIGAIFHAPLAGAIFAIEVLYRDPDFEAEALIPAFIATAVSYCVFSVMMLMLTGRYAFEPLFQIPPDLQFNNPWLLMPLVVLAGAMSLASLGYVKCFSGVTVLFKRLAIPNHFKPAIGAFLTGALALVAYLTLNATTSDKTAATDSLSVLSFGYGFLQKVLTPGDATLLVPVLLIVGLGKIVTTSLTIGSGGSGGVFGPSIVIGGTLGAVVGLIFERLGVVGASDVTIFTILGMASFFAAAANTPVSTLIMVSELTASYELLLPSMWVCAISYLMSRRWTLYTQQVKSRLESPAHRGDFIIDILEGMTVQQALSKVHREYMPVAPDLPLKEMDRLITGSHQICFPVVSADGRYEGLFGLNDMRQFLYDTQLADLAVAADLATKVKPLTLDMDLSSAIGLFARSRFEELPVVSDAEPDKVIGMLRRQDVISAYSSQLLAMRRDHGVS